jgi:hypothetical protein
MIKPDLMTSVSLGSKALRSTAGALVASVSTPLSFQITPKREETIAMSHFSTYVLIPENTEDVEFMVEELLAPYDEGLEVEPYETECDCVRYGAIEQAHELCSVEHGPIEAAQEEFEKLMAEQPDADEDVEWARFMKERDDFIEAQVKRLLPTISPDLDCEECGGKGVVTSTYNQNAKWDWWEIGGRWRNVLENSRKNGAHRESNGSVATLNDLDRDKLPPPFAIVTPDGAWHAHGEMGWFARISCLDEEWESKAQAILSEHQDCILVLVDCHAA